MMQSTTAKIPTYDARILTAGQAMAQITLDGQIYTLRITKAEKLILTK
nr:hemin uptake protein HemP [Pseudorhodobacter wandonensis]